MCFPDPPKLAEEIAFVDYHQKREGHPDGCPSWFVSLLLGVCFLEAEAELELRVLEDRDVVVVDVVGVLSHNLKLDEVVRVQHRGHADAEDEVLCD